MNIILMVNSSENNAINKTLATVKSVEAVLKEETSIIDPVLVITGNECLSCNYIEIPAFGRKYFITNIEGVRNNVWRISCHVDVLETYKTQILQQTAVISRQENQYNLYLDDGTLLAYSNPQVVTKAFPVGFNDVGTSTVIITAGK